ncbi:DUF115 domain-containing protein [Desulfobulbus rhabdoformis]|uniref:6-hydroxymethylpterin diphosphokinase MptE-like protein n=1 Tax=Desulfobulbus rhabdoformis TaxID=34032 RepID=UPI001964647A|nr:6-hydroxymethylpterin diphosphokinase MptE-like protein [Desulfobulbus rhabdoformis]MBM9613657.1 DUF115 domain-containing protein [Desulfobulbus rhabdoformis]
MNRLERFKNRHIGERVVVVANGPSLNTMDLCFLRQETAIGMNKIFLGLNKFRFYPKYYVAINRKVIEQSINNIKSLNCNKFISMRGSELLPEDALTYHLETQNPPARFSKDITRGIHEGWTVTYAAIQVAYFLGFSEVVIIGMDHRYQFTGQPNEARRQDGPDPNHFCPEYFGGGQHWDNPDLKNSEESYRIARTEFENDGRRILDATLDGACEIFEKIHYKDYFGLR